MYNLKRASFLTAFVLSCGNQAQLNFKELNGVHIYDGKFGRLEGLEVPDEILTELESFIPTTIELPKKFNIVKIQNLAPWQISRRNIILNNFKISDYKDFKYQGADNSFYSYHISGEEKHLLVSRYLGLVISCSEQGEFLVPEKVFFSLKYGGFACMDIEYLNNQTKFIYKDSCVVINNGTAKENPFDLNASCVNIDSLTMLTKELASTVALQYVKYFFDCAAFQNGARITYSDDDYFSYKYNILGDQYFHMRDRVEDIKERIQEFQKYILEVQNKNQDLYFTKLFVEFSVPGIEAIKHVTLLILYKKQWFFLDTNGRYSDYDFDNSRGGNNLAKAMSELGIQWLDNDIFIQQGSTCDTCASLMEYFFSLYYAKNKKLPLINKNNNINLKKIESFLQKENLNELMNNFFQNIVH